MESEVQVDEDIKRFNNITAYLNLLPIFVKSSVINNKIKIFKNLSNIYIKKRQFNY